MNTQITNMDKIKAGVDELIGTKRITGYNTLIAYQIVSDYLQNQTYENLVEMVEKLLKYRQVEPFKVSKV